LEDGRVCVDMGEPFLNVEDVPTTLEATRDGNQAIAVPIEVAGSLWTITAVGMGNPHAVVYSRDGADVVVCFPLSRFVYHAVDVKFGNVSNS
jgi:diaminopimelate epimerase